MKLSSGLGGESLCIAIMAQSVLEKGYMKKVMKNKMEVVHWESFLCSM
jgi:hypothetical protein